MSEVLVVNKPDTGSKGMASRVAEDSSRVATG